MPITRYWLIPPDARPKMFMPHPTMSSEEMRARTQGVWDRFYSLPHIWKRSRLHAQSPGAAGVHVHLQAVPADVCEHRNRDGQRPEKPGQPVGALLAKPCRKLFAAKPMPELQAPERPRSRTPMFPEFGPDTGGLNVLD